MRLIDADWTDLNTRWLSLNTFLRRRVAHLGQPVVGLRGHCLLGRFLQESKNSPIEISEVAHIGSAVRLIERRKRILRRYRQWVAMGRLVTEEFGTAAADEDLVTEEDPDDIYCKEFPGRTLR